VVDSIIIPNSKQPDIHAIYLQLFVFKIVCFEKRIAEEEPLALRTLHKSQALEVSK